VLDPAETALLCIDVQNLDLEIPADPQEAARWFPFHRRMREIVIPTMRGLQDAFRAKGMDVIHARIACVLEDGRDRSLSHKKPVWNALLPPKDSTGSQLVPELVPLHGEIVVTETTDSALSGTNLRLILASPGSRNVVLTGIFTDQCVSSTVRSLVDESFFGSLTRDTTRHT
jgi:nicotinamidase-related amidase